jgi:pimeloyl-ACP methyl ester carboxylesterase
MQRRTFRRMTIGHNAAVPYFQTFDPQDDARAHAELRRVDDLSTIHDTLWQGLSIRWRRFGPGHAPTTQPPLVLLHGGHGSWMHWIRNVEALSAARALWVPDLPGYHESDAPAAPGPGQAPLDPLLDALAGSFDTLVDRATPIDLGGFSFGGFVASQFALRRGAIRRLALVGSGGHGTLRRLAVEMVNWRAAADRGAERAALLRNLAALMLHDKAAIDPLAFAIHDISCHATRFRSKEVSLAGGLQQALDTLGGPQLLLWGEFDVTADPRPLVAQLVHGHPLREGAVVDGAGHWAQFERAAEVNERLLRFLD